jgi:hypothetical protein
MIRDYIVLQKPQEGTDRLPPPRTLIMDFVILMELCGSRLGQKFDTTDSFISIAQTR